MADNEKVYKTTIDVETGDAAKNIDLLNKKVSTSLGDFENLNEAISKTQDTLGKLDPKSAEFKELSKELQGLKDNLRDTEIQSSRFTEALAAQPGVIGFVGQSLEGLRGTFQVFMANPIIAVLAAIAGAFLALRESLTRTEEGTAKLNKITEGFTKILNGLFAIIEPIAMQLADLVTGLLENEKVMDGLSKTVGVLTGVFTTLFGTLKEVGGFLINTLVNNFKTLIGVAKGAGDVIAGVFTFDWDRIKEGANAAFEAVKEGVSNTIDNVKDLGNGVVEAAVDGFKAGESAFKEGFQRLTETQKEEAEKAAEEQKKALEEAQRVQTEAYLALLDDRNRELTQRETKFNEDKAKLIAAGIKDFTQLEEVYRKDVEAINDKYDEIALAKQQEQINKQKELLDGLTEYRSLESELEAQRLEQSYNKQIAIINEKEQLGLLTEEQASQQRIEAQKKRYEERLALVSAEEQNLLNNINETERLLLENTQLTEDERTAIRLQAEQQRELIENEFSLRRKEVQFSEDEDKLLRIESELSQLGNTFDRQRALVAEKEALLLEQEGLTEEQRTAIKRAAAEERMAIDMMELDAKAEIQNAQFDLLAQFGGFLNQIAGENKKLQIAAVIAEQVAAIGRIITNTAIANAKAVAASPLTFGQPWVAINTASAALGIASSVAAGVKAVKDIKNSDKSESPARASGSSLPKPAAPRIGGATIPESVGTAQEVNTGGQIAEAISVARGEDRDKPVRAYVVSQDISSKQALDRRINQAATFG